MQALDAGQADSSPVMDDHGSMAADMGVADDEPAALPSGDGVDIRSASAAPRRPIDCSTIIVSYNTFDLTRDAVRSVLDTAGTLEVEVIVVDNASPDDSAARLRHAFPTAQFPNVDVIANDDNRGFSAANNQGARRASGRVLFFLNPDAIVHAGAIPRLVALLDARPDLGAVGPRVLNPDGTDQPSAFRFYSARELVRQYLPVATLADGSSQRADPIMPASGPTDVVKGCAIALRRADFDAVGGWDESYFMYAEETEMCWQLRARDLTTYFLREAVVTHIGGVASREQYVEQQLMDRRSALQFLRRHGTAGLVFVNRVAGVAGYAARAAAFAFLARARPARAADYQVRGRAASALWRWFLFDYS